jgi:hypothetical protein
MLKPSDVERRNTLHVSIINCWENEQVPLMSQRIPFTSLVQFFWFSRSKATRNGGALFRSQTGEQGCSILALEEKIRTTSRNNAMLLLASLHKNIGSDLAFPDDHNKKEIMSVSRVPPAPCVNIAACAQMQRATRRKNTKHSDSGVSLARFLKTRLAPSHHRSIPDPRAILNWRSPI